MQFMHRGCILSTQVRFRRQESSSEHLDVVSSAGVAFERLRSVSSTGRPGRPGAVPLTGIVFATLFKRLHSVSSTGVAF